MFSLVALVAIVLVLFFFSGLLEEFPNAALGALVIWAATRLIEWDEFRALFRFRKTEFLLAIATTAGVVLSDILVGVMIAILLSVTDLIARIARPHDAVLGKVPEMSGYHDVEDYPDAETISGLLVYRYDAPLFFANADDFRDSLMEEIENSDDTCRWVILQCEAIGRIDSTATQVLREMIDELHEGGVLVGMAELKWDLADQLQRVGILEIVGDENVYTTIDDAIAAYRAAIPAS
jgi:MFS superfamily sulfate permease-like transporter